MCEKRRGDEEEYINSDVGEGRQGLEGVNESSNGI
jgi:hypothetical protein